MPTDASPWTIDQLTEQVADALSAGPAQRSKVGGQPNGRVRQVPDVRTIRWYTTIGLLDRPSEMRGRTALYGRRHLAQIVAIKRLQAAGKSLTEVQEQLIGADDATLFRIAGLAGSAGIAGIAGTADSTAAAGLEDGTAERSALPESSGTDRGVRFWSAPPKSPPAAGSAPEDAASEGQAPKGRAPEGPAPEDAPPVHGVRLAEDVTLLLTAARRAPDTAERHALAEAARPLLDLARRLGLTEH
jgi:DNA-binding transcriptional MerR regulator